jgi:WD40 repeat protein
VSPPSAATNPERLVSGSDDFTLFLWEPSDNKKPLERMTGHQQVGFVAPVVQHMNWCCIQELCILGQGVSIVRQ